MWEAALSLIPGAGLIPLAAGAISGIAKNSAAKKQEAADRQLAADTQRYSWITGNQAAPVKTAGPLFGDVAQGALTGAMFNQNIESANAANKLQGAQTSYWENLMKQRKEQPSLYGNSSGQGMLGVNTNLGY